VTDTPLAGRVALVTGASRGIGSAIATSLAAAGAVVGVGYGGDVEAAGRVVAEIEASGGRAAALAADLRDMRAAAKLVSEAEAALGGGIDILINNAGITRDNLALRLSDDDWQDVIAVDLSAAFALSRAALRHMLRSRWGRIVNVTSVSGVIGNAGQANYAAAKAGLIGLTKSLAREVATRNITVNAVAPGFIDTDMTRALTESQRQAAVAAVPAGRMGTAAEVAAAVRFLSEPAASYITGHVLHVDGALGA